MAATGRINRYRVEQLVVILMVLLGAVLMLRSDTLSKLSLTLHDRMLPLVSQPSLEQVAVVSFDWRLADQGEKRRRYARLIDTLSAVNVQALVLDAQLEAPFHVDLQADLALEQAMQHSQRVFLPVRIGRASGRAPLQEIVPYGPFSRAAAGLGHIGFAPSDGGQIRGLHLRAGVGEGWWPHLALQVLEFLEPGALAEYPAREGTPDQGPEVRQYYRTLTFRPVSRLLRLDGDALLAGDEDASRLAGRVVFVGDGQRASASLALAGSAPASGSDALAVVFASLAQDRLIRPLETPVVWLATLLLALLLPLLLPRFAASQGWLVLLAVLLLVTLSGLALLAAGLWLPLAPALGSVLLAFPLWTWRRLDYSLGYLRTAMAGSDEQRGLDRRLLLPSTIQSLASMVDRVLPVSGWRLVKLPGTLVTSGGERLAETAWQGRRARQYGFPIHGERYELVLVWQDEDVSLALDAWVRAMVQRCSVTDPPPAIEQILDGYLIKVAEQARRERALSGFFEATLASLGDGVLISDACGTLIYANARAAGWLGLALDRPAAMHVLELGDRLRLGLPSHNWPDLLHCAMAAGRCSVECRVVEGPELYLDILRTRAADSPGEVLVITLRDISELKAALRGRSQAVDLLSHDLRSPMLSLQALCERRRQEPLNIGEQAFVEQIEQSARRSLDIAEQFLQLIRAESLPPEQLVLLDMLSVAEAAFEVARPEAQAQGMRLRFNYDPRDPVWVHGSSDLLELALLNLLRLTIRRAGPEFRVSLRLIREGDRVLCQVSDNAPGLDAQALQRWRTGKGADVTLRLVHTVLERHGGTLEISTDSQRGSRLTLSLPATEPE